MKKLFLLLTILGSCVAASAQVSTNPIVVVTTDITGASTCVARKLYYNATSGVNWERNNAGVCTKITAGSTPVSGSGTSGQVGVWNGTASLTGDADLTFATDTLTTTKLVVNNVATANRIGVGTAAAPANGIDVGAPGGNVMLNMSASSVPTGYVFSTFSNTAGTAYVGIDNSTGSTFSGGNYAFILGHGSNNPMAFITNAVPRLTIAGTGAATFSGSVTVSSTMFASTNLTNAAGTPGSICYNTGTFEITKNNALTCTVSSRRFKQDIINLSKTNAFDRLRPVQFAYRDHPDRVRYGFIAEEAAAVDTRFGDGYDAKGIPTSIDQNAILAATVAEVQDLKIRMLNLEKQNARLRRIVRRRR